MGAIPTTTANKLVDHLNAVASFTEPTSPLKLRLMTANGSASTAGTEVTGGSYASQSITMGSSASGTAANTNAITFSGMPACTVVGVEIWDSSGTPQRLWWGATTSSQPFNAGNTGTVAVGAITTTLN